MSEKLKEEEVKIKAEELKKNYGVTGALQIINEIIKEIDILNGEIENERKTFYQKVKRVITSKYKPNGFHLIESYEIMKEGVATTIMNRRAYGYDALQLLGLYELVKTDVIKQYKGEIKPDIVQRTVFKD